MPFIRKSNRMIRYKASTPSLILTVLYQLLINGRIIRGINPIDYGQEVPIGGFPPDRIISEDSQEWQMIREAAKQAYKDIRRRWGFRAGSVIAGWYSQIEYLFIFESPQGEDDEYDGVTDIEFSSDPHAPTGNQQAVHLALYDSSGKPVELHILTETINHEGMHLREAHHGLPDQRELENIIREYIKSGNYEPWFQEALTSDVELLPWVWEKATSGKTQDAVGIWRQRFPNIVKWLVDRQDRLFPQEDMLFPEEPTNDTDQQQARNKP